MADAPSLGDFFAKKNKKKIKGSNLNVVSSASKPETKKPKSKDAEEENWQEEQVVVATMKVEGLGKLTRDEDKKDDEDNAAPAWGSVKAKAETSSINERKFPTLKSSMRVTTNINIDDGSEAKVNIATSKNVFAALENEEDDEDHEAKRPKEIKPAMVQKKKGEMQKMAIQREVDKYSTKKDSGKREGRDGEDEDDEDEDEADEEAAEEQQPAAEEPQPAPEGKKKKAEKKDAGDKETEKEKEKELREEVPDDLKIMVDAAASQAKYVGRKKPFPAKPLPKSELEAEKENKPAKQQPSKKKKGFINEEDYDKPKLQYADW